MTGGDEARIGGEGEGGHPGLLRHRGQRLAGRDVPDGQIVAGRGQDPRVGAEAPEGFEVAQRLPVALLAGAGVPASQDAGVLDSPECAVGSEGQLQQLAVRVKLWLAEGRENRCPAARQYAGCHGLPSPWWLQW